MQARTNVGVDHIMTFVPRTLPVAVAPWSVTGPSHNLRIPTLVIPVGLTALTTNLPETVHTIECI